MRGKRFKEEQIIAILKEAESGISVTDLCRKYGEYAAIRFITGQYWIN
jgi:hypothetical protein